MASETSFHDLVPVKTREVGEATIQTVNARRLHDTLLVGKDFSNWIKGRIERFGFEEGRDYITEARSPILASGNRGAGTEYHLSIDMAKEIAMVENNDRGRAVRRYFIECERLLRDGLGMSGGFDPKVMGGIVKAVCNRLIEDALERKIPDTIAAMLAADPRVAVGEYVSVRELLDEAKALPKKRRGLNTRIGNALREICLRDGVGARRCPRTRTWLFPVAMAHDYMRRHGVALVKDHNDQVVGQGRLFAIPGGLSGAS